MLAKRWDITSAGILVMGLLLGAGVVNGCSGFTTDGAYFICPDAEVPGLPECSPDAGTMSPQSVECEGKCISMGTSDFTKDAVLLWKGAEEEAPECPERASSVFYTGYGDLVVDIRCAECSCSTPECILPQAIGADSKSFCMSGISDNYAAPENWNGKCTSPALFPPGSFSSIALTSPTATPCVPSEDPPAPEPPKFAPDLPTSYFAPTPMNLAFGIYFNTYAKACQGNARGECKSSGESCVPSAEPPPPGFRHCVQYELPVDEDNLPKCPAAFPTREVFYEGAEGDPSCSPCECMHSGSKCEAAITLFQDEICAGVPQPAGPNPANATVCLDFTGMGFTLAAMSAQWVTNEPGACLPVGGKPVGEIKAVNPRVYCCQ
ncbi:MAG: hypothetical protein IPM54_38600 [Polyangiaceae bacterium]|nr:hypothetical protein [Polyangiaceae bacterium]